MKARSISAIASALVILGVAPTVAEEALAKRSGCFECHGVEQRIIGPAFRDIAAKYKADTSARAALIETVTHGGKGHWTEFSRGVPMPPYSGRLSDTEIQQLVDWVLAR